MQHIVGSASEDAAAERAGRVGRRSGEAAIGKEGPQFLLFQPGQRDLNQGLLLGQFRSLNQRACAISSSTEELGGTRHLQVGRLRGSTTTPGSRCNRRIRSALARRKRSGGFHGLLSRRSPLARVASKGGPCPARCSADEHFRAQRDASSAPASSPRACCTFKYASATYSVVSLVVVCNAALRLHHLTSGQRLENSVREGEDHRWTDSAHERTMAIALDQGSGGGLQLAVVPQVIAASQEGR